MRPEEMMEGIRHIEDAHVDAGARRCPPKLRSPWGMIASAACLCLVIAGVVFLRGAGYRHFVNRYNRTRMNRLHYLTI